MKLQFLFRLTFCLLSFLIFNTAESFGQLGGNYTINANNPTTNNNFQSFSDFANALSNQGVIAPVNVDVVPNSGPYYERVVFNSHWNPGKFRIVTINGNGETLAFSPDSSDYRILGFNGAKYITIKNLRIEAQNNFYGFGVHFTNNSSYITIENCTVDMSQITSYSTSKVYSVGILASGGDTNTYPTNNLTASYLTIKNNKLIGSATGSAHQGIRLNGSYTNNNIGNTVINNTIINSYGTSILAYNQEDLIISGNKISRPSRVNAASTFAVNGILIFGSHFEGAIIEKNKIFNMLGGSINSNMGSIGINLHDWNNQVSTTKPIIIKNNIIQNSAKSNGYLIGLNIRGTHNTKIYHNTISFDEPGQQYGDTKGIVLKNEGTYIQGFECKNNIVSITRFTSGEQIGINIDRVFNNQLECNFNNVYVTSHNNGQSYFGAVSNNKFIDLANWQTATSLTGTPLNLGTNSKEVDPKFLTNTDLMPLDTNLLSAGDTVGVEVDFYGSFRDTLNPDLGAINSGCFKPIKLHADIVDTTVLISWVDRNQTGLWQMAFDTVRSSGISNNYFLVRGNPDTLLSGLKKGGHYQAYIRSVCSSGDTSRWSKALDIYIKKPLAAGNYTIDSTRVTGNNNFQSFYDCADYLNKNGISGSVNIDVVPGTGPYNNRFIIDSLPTNQFFNSLTLNGNGELIQFPNKSNQSEKIISLNKVKNVTIDSLNVKLLNTESGICYFIGTEVDSTTISYSTMEIPNYSLGSSYGVYVGNIDSNYIPPNNLTIENNIINGGINGGPYHAIQIRQNVNNLFATEIKINNNQISNFRHEGINVGNIENFEIIGNDISNNMNDGFSFELIGIKVLSAQNGLISKNRIHDIISENFFHYDDIIGIEISSSPPSNLPIIVSNNLIYNLSTDESLSGIKHSGNENIHYLHNSVYFREFPIVRTGTEIIAFQRRYGTGLTVKNNNFFIEAAAGTLIGLDYFTTPGLGSNINLVSDYNNIYVNHTRGGSAHIGTYDSAVAYTARFKTMNDWQNTALHNLDQHSISINPNFFSFSNLNPLNPILASAGDSSAVATDFDNLPRNTPPTIGAFEFDTNLVNNIPYYPIHKINTENSNGISDSLGVRCWTSGSVLDFNMDEKNIIDQYILSENTTQNQEGIQAISTNPQLAFPNNSGDSILIRGIVIQDEGMTSFYVDSIKILKSNAFLPSADNYRSINDSIESKLVKYSDMWVLNEYNTYYGIFTASNGVDTIDFFINSNSNIADSSIKKLLIGDTICSITGIGYQVDDTKPFNSGYRVIPINSSTIDTISCQTVSVEERAGLVSEVEIYPNPAKEVLNIRMPDIKLQFDLIIYDASGNRIKHIRNANKVQNISELSSGLYFIELKNEDSGSVFKRQQLIIIK